MPPWQLAPATHCACADDGPHDSRLCGARHASEYGSQIVAPLGLDAQLSAPPSVAGVQRQTLYPSVTPPQS